MSTQPGLQNGDGLANRQDAENQRMADELERRLKAPTRDAAEGARPSIAWLAEEIAAKALAMMSGQASYLQHIVKCAETIQVRLADAAPPNPAPDAPGHTDLMVTPESIDAFMEKNPLPAPDAMREALRPFAEYAKHMASAWTALDNSVYYGVKREFAPQITYGDFRRAGDVYFAAPVPPADGVARTFKTCLSCEMRQTCRDMNHCYGPSHAELKERFALSPPCIGAADHERVFIDICEELGCAYDNEAALIAIANLKSGTGAAEPGEDSDTFADMLWKWFEDRGCDLRSERHDGLSADNFKIMLDEHEAALTDVAHPVRGDRETITNAIINNMPTLMGLNKAVDAILSFPVPPGAGEREAAIEECARAAEQWASRIGCHASEIATGIRALSRQAPHSSSEDGR